jgi:hypothetical protein
MTMDSWGPLAGFSIGFFLLMGALWLFLFFLMISVPFSLFSIRNQLKLQLAVLQRIEETSKQQLALTPPPAPQPKIGIHEPPPIP